MIYYFTGTGNSLWTARELGRKLKEPVESILHFKEEREVVCRDTVVGLVFPTYGGDLPWIAKEFLLKLELQPDCYVFVVMTSNNGKSGRAFRSVDQALAFFGAHLSAGFDLQMPGNCLKSTDEQNTDRLNRAPGQVEQIAEGVMEKKVNFCSDGSKAENGFVENSFCYGEHSFKRLTFMKNFQITKACNGCGICRSLCPTGNIAIRNGKAVHGDRCAACYACLHWCPSHAVLLKVPSLKHRKQYHHPEVALRELM